MRALIAILHKRRENVTNTAITMLKTLKPKKTEDLGIASPTIIKIAKTLKALQTSKIDSHIIIGHIFSKTLDTDKPQPMKLENATLVFEGRTYPLTKSPSNIEAIAKELQRNHEKEAETIIKEIEGNFAFTIAEPSRLIAGRDPLGTQPLYYGENADLAALASERKTLWKIGIKEPHSFPPGQIALINRNGFKFKPVKTLTYSKPKQLTIHEAAEELQTLLQHSVKERISELKEVAVAFSGGLDSSIVAFLAKKSNTNVHLIHVSLENQPETEHAKKVAEELKMPIHIHLFRRENVEAVVPKLLEIIEEPNPVQTSIGIPFYWTAEKTAEMNLKAMLAGQGADELFGGYSRYVDDYLLHGKETARKKMFKDVTKLHETNLERDSKICNFHDVELRLPFATYRIARFALDLPLELKIEPKKNTLRKLVLRKVAINLGLPKHVVEKPKKAIQYTTGINNSLNRIAKKKGLTVNEYLQKTFKEIRNDVT